MMCPSNGCQLGWLWESQSALPEIFLPEFFRSQRMEDGRFATAGSPGRGSFFEKHHLTAQTNEDPKTTRPLSKITNSVVLVKN